MKKVLILLQLLLASVSFMVIVVISGASAGTWALASSAPVMLLSAVSLAFKVSLLQTLLVPAMLFYGLGALFFLEWSLRHSFAHLSGAVLTAGAAYILLARLVKLKIISTVVRVLLGALILASFLFIRSRLAVWPEMQRIAELENKVFCSR